MLNVNRITIKPFLKDMFREFFEIDCDFLENIDYFRDDTLKLGYENEAARCSEELTEKFVDEWNAEQEHSSKGFADLFDKYIEIAANLNSDGTQFILGNGSYCSEYEITSIFNNDEAADYMDEFDLIISYVTY